MKISLYVSIIVTFISVTGAFILEWLFGLGHFYGVAFLYVVINFGLSTYHINELYNEIERLQKEQKHIEERFNIFL